MNANVDKAVCNSFPVRDCKIGVEHLIAEPCKVLSVRLKSNILKTCVDLVEGCRSVDLADELDTAEKIGKLHSRFRNLCNRCYVDAKIFTDSKQTGKSLFHSLVNDLVYHRLRDRCDVAERFCQRLFNQCLVNLARRYVESLTVNGCNI